MNNVKQAAKTKRVHFQEDAGKSKAKKPKENKQKQRKQPKKRAAAEDNENGPSLKRHKDELDDLATKDPEFYQFLKENDVDLLNFGADEDGEENDTPFEEIEVDEMQSEDDDEEGEVTGQVGKEKKKKSKATAGATLNSSSLAAIISKATKGSLKDIKHLVLLFKSASNPEFEDGEESLASLNGLGAASPEMYEEVLSNALNSLHLGWTAYLSLPTTLNRGILAKLGENNAWKKLKNATLTFFKALLSMLQTASITTKHQQITGFLLESLARYIPFLAPLPRLTSTTIKVLSQLLFARVTDSNGLEEHTIIRELILLRLRQILKQLPGAAGAEVMRVVYLQYARQAKSCSETTLPQIEHLCRGIAELYSHDPALAYQQAFLSIRQLALLVRKAFLDHNATSLQSIRSWQFLHCIRLWTDVICRLPQEEKGLGALMYPLAQVMQAWMARLTSPYLLPARLLLISFQQRLAASAERFLPSGLALIEVLETLDLGVKAQASTTPPPQLKLLLALPNNSLPTAIVKETILQEVIQLLRFESEVFRYTIALPEYLFPLQRRLRAIVKKCRVDKARQLIKALLAQWNELSTFVKTERQRLQLTPMTAASAVFEVLRPQDKEKASDRLVKMIAMQQGRAVAAGLLGQSQQQKNTAAATSQKGKNGKQQQQQDDDDEEEEDEMEVDDDEDDEQDKDEDDDDEEDEEGEVQEMGDEEDEVEEMDLDNTDF